ncbi:MAG: hypothetical protein FWG39_02400 [Alphaproteobacteria bacterium]|nr:hypothetical protein [Alphaproteobacteria bacterium]
MFYKISTFVLLLIVVFGAWVFMRANPMKNQGAMSWAEMYSDNPAMTLHFLDKTLGIKVSDTIKMNDGSIYNAVKARGQFWAFGGVMGLPTMQDGTQVAPGSMIYLTVKDYDKSHEAMVEYGAVAHLVGQVAEGMKFGVYTIPGGVTVGIAQYDVKK